MHIRTNVLKIKIDWDNIFYNKGDFFFVMLILFFILCVSRPLGQGAFGEVYEGQLLNPADNSYIPVAVKVSSSETDS